MWSARPARFRRDHASGGRRHGGWFLTLSTRRCGAHEDRPGRALLLSPDDSLVVVVLTGPRAALRPGCDRPGAGRREPLRARTGLVEHSLSSDPDLHSPAGVEASRAVGDSRPAPRTHRVYAGILEHSAAASALAQQRGCKVVRDRYARSLISPPTPPGRAGSELKVEFAEATLLARGDQERRPRIAYRDCGTRETEANGPAPSGKRKLTNGASPFSFVCP